MRDTAERDAETSLDSARQAAEQMLSRANDERSMLDAESKRLREYRDGLLGYLSGVEADLSRFLQEVRGPEGRRPERRAPATPGPEPRAGGPAGAAGPRAAAPAQAEAPVTGELPEEPEPEPASMPRQNPAAEASQRSPRAPQPSTLAPARPEARPAPQQPASADRREQAPQPPAAQSPAAVPQPKQPPPSQPSAVSAPATDDPRRSDAATRTVVVSTGVPGGWSRWNWCSILCRKAVTVRADNGMAVPEARGSMRGCARSNGSSTWLPCCWTRIGR